MILYTHALMERYLRRWLRETTDYEQIWKNLVPEVKYEQSDLDALSFACRSPHRWFVCGWPTRAPKGPKDLYVREFANSYIEAALRRSAGWKARYGHPYGGLSFVSLRLDVFGDRAGKTATIRQFVAGSVPHPVTTDANREAGILFQGSWLRYLEEPAPFRMIRF
jgi:hypothetical protein